MVSTSRGCSGRARQKSRRSAATRPGLIRAETKKMRRGAALHRGAKDSSRRQRTAPGTENTGGWACHWILLGVMMAVPRDDAHPPASRTRSLQRAGRHPEAEAAATALSEEAVAGSLPDRSRVAEVQRLRLRSAAAAREEGRPHRAPHHLHWDSGLLAPRSSAVLDIQASRHRVGKHARSSSRHLGTFMRWTGVSRAIRGVRRRREEHGAALHGARSGSCLMVAQRQRAEKRKRLVRRASTTVGRRAEGAESCSLSRLREQDRRPRRGALGPRRHA